MARTAEARRYVGGGVLRKEDPKLLTGQGTFVESIAPPGTLWVSMVRSPYAHARIKKVNVKRALAAPGVEAAFSGADLAGE